MELQLIDNDGKYEDVFIQWLLTRMIDTGIASINYDKLVKVEEQVNQLDQFKDKPLDLYNVVKFGLYNLCWRRYGNEKISISIDSNISVIGMSAKLSTICKLINYGNIYFKGYPIFSDLFRDTKKNIDSLYDEWWESGGKWYHYTTEQ